MTVRNVKKNLAGQQDLLPGLGPYEQIRRGLPTVIDGPANSYIRLWKSYIGEDKYAGTFEDGCIINGAKTVVVSLTKGEAYEWIGSTPKIVDPTVSPDLGAAWTIVTEASFVRWVESGLPIIQAPAGLDSRSLSEQLYIVASIKNFGAKGDGVTNDTVALDRARYYLYTELAAGNRVKLLWEPGRYIYTNSPNWAMNRLNIEFIGEVWLINEGEGSTFVMDGGATGPGVYGCNVKGFPLLYGGADTQHGAYIRAVHRSQLDLECRGAGSKYSGLYQEWNVSNTIQFQMNFNAGGLYNTPARGITQTLRNASEETSYCTLINPETSGMPIGIYQDGALGNIIMGGASQACTTAGLVQTANAWNNKFYGTDFEANADDIVSNARESQFFGVDCEKSIKFQSAAMNCSVIGGITENVIIEAGADHTLLSGLVYNRLGLGSITDNATTTRYRDLRDKAQNLIHNKPRARTDISVGTSPFTYTNTSGQDERISIYGGSVSQAVLSRFAGDIVPNSGVYTLSPGDSLTITFTTAPAFVRYSC